MTTGNSLSLSLSHGYRHIISFTSLNHSVLFLTGATNISLIQHYIIPLSYGNCKLTFRHSFRWTSSPGLLHHSILSFYKPTIAVSPVVVSWEGSGEMGGELGVSTVHMLSWGHLGSGLRVAGDRRPPSYVFRTHSLCGHLSEPALGREEWQGVRGGFRREGKS